MANHTLVCFAPTPKSVLPNQTHPCSFSKKLIPQDPKSREVAPGAPGLKHHMGGQQIPVEVGVGLPRHQHHLGFLAKRPFVSSASAPYSKEHGSIFNSFWPLFVSMLWAAFVRAPFWAWVGTTKGKEPVLRHPQHLSALGALWPYQPYLHGRYRHRNGWNAHLWAFAGLSPACTEHPQKHICQNRRESNFGMVRFVEESSRIQSRLLSHTFQGGRGIIFEHRFWIIFEHRCPQTQNGSFSNTWGGYPAAPVGWGARRLRVPSYLGFLS